MEALYLGQRSLMLQHPWNPRVMTKLTNLIRFFIVAIPYFSCHSMPQNRTDSGATDTINCVAICQGRLHEDSQNPKNIYQYLPSAVFIAQRLMVPSKHLKHIIQIEHNIVKNLKRPDANQLAIYKRLQEWSRIWTQGHCETNPASGQSGIQTQDCLTASPTHWPRPLGLAASKTKTIITGNGNV